ncbi:MAG: VRR-NUC domain-containing protein [Christensenellaceae bacterium]|jgi:hypothetical protein|nr:VRR-NUC domain-containing protein [Christensenellaceae bacterium]
MNGIEGRGALNEPALVKRVDLPPAKEADEQEAYFAWIRTRLGKWPELVLAHAVPNGGSRHKVEAARLKAQGVRAGIPDIFIPVPRGIYHGAYIELKRTKGGRLSKAQKEIIPRLREQGYFVAVCEGWFDAAGATLAYMMLAAGQKL